jgi:Xaa-Pro dipeptidase
MVRPASPAPIGLEERRARLDALGRSMDEAGLSAVLLGATSSLRYFTGLVWSPSERFCGALVTRDGALDYICPRFEETKVAGLIGVPGFIMAWEEEESPYRLIADRLDAGARLGVDDQMALFFYLGLGHVLSSERLADAGSLINRLRRLKSAAELALMARAKAITLEVQRRARNELRAGIRASAVERFIDAEHRALGAEGGSSFCIVSFGEDTALPHGGEADRALRDGDVVLIDTGCRLDGYHSDITRTYVFGDPSSEIRAVWEHEKAAQQAAFDAARLGASCASVDAAARALLEAAGYGPGYGLPGLPHRTGHGIGLDIHEAPNLVRGEAALLEPGMCFSNEPTIVIPGKFGVRLEDHFHMTATGPRWFTPPAASLDDPFANVAEFA